LRERDPAPDNLKALSVLFLQRSGGMRHHRVVLPVRPHRAEITGFQFPPEGRCRIEGW